jgi:DNA-binding IclR family transcriptional regulator
MKSVTPAAATPGAPGAADERYMAPALGRGLALLECFGPEKPALGLAELARQLGITRSSCFRLAYTLAELGFLVRDDARKAYRLGPRVLSLGFAYLASQSLVEVARPHLEALRDGTNCAAHLGVLDGTEVVYLARHPDKKALTSRIQVGARLPAHATSMGRVLLASLPPEEVRRRYNGRALRAFTAQTATTLDALLARLAEDRARGYVVSRAAFEPGIASVAAPVFGMDGRAAAAINVSTPEATLRGRALETTIKDAVVATAAAISQWLVDPGQQAA